MDSSCNTNAGTLCSNQNPICPYCCCGMGPDPVDGKDVTICCAEGVSCNGGIGCQGAVYSFYDSTKCNGNSYCGQKLTYNSSTKQYDVTEIICCSGGYVCCGGKCCPDGHCKDAGNGKICCPNSTDTICNNQCCASGICCNNQCCPSGYSCCGSTCCPPDKVCCDGICCDKNNCINGSYCSKPCYGKCCGSGHYCCKDYKNCVSTSTPCL